MVRPHPEALEKFNIGLPQQDLRFSEQKAQEISGDFKWPKKLARFNRKTRCFVKINEISNFFSPHVALFQEYRVSFGLKD